MFVLVLFFSVALCKAYTFPSTPSASLGGFIRAMAQLNNVTQDEVLAFLGHGRSVHRPARVTNCGNVPPFLQNSGGYIRETLGLPAASQEILDVPNFSSVVLDDFITPSAGTFTICNIEFGMGFSTPNPGPVPTTFRMRIYDSNPANFPSVSTYGNPLCVEDVTISIARGDCTAYDLTPVGTCSSLILAPSTTYYYGMQTVMSSENGQSYYCRPADPTLVPPPPTFYNPGGGFIGQSPVDSEVTVLPNQDVGFAIEFLSLVQPTE